MNSLVITRHKALVDFLRERQIIEDNAEVIIHATPDDVKGRRVIGVLPLRLACLAAEVVEVTLDVPAAMRGAELTIDQVRKFYRGISTYKVTKLEESK